MSDNVNHPPHYTGHPSGVECISITEHMSFCVGNAVKYLWRADLKGSAVEDLKKAAWYVNREIERRNAIAEIQQQKTNEKPEENAITRVCDCVKSGNECENCRKRIERVRAYITTPSLLR